MSTAERGKAVLSRRLLPLRIAVFLQGLGFWVPIEKLFMTEIGFDAASVGLMAAAYAAFTPLIEIPSGILADRWSRRGVLILSSVALSLCALVGGLSGNVPIYIVSALILGIYFAMYSGTMDSVVYDTVLEETGDSKSFEQQLGRIRLVNSAALVASALAGGLLAGLVGNRGTYFLTVPFTALSIVALLRFAEPRLHKADQPTSLRSHLGTTYRTVLRRGRLLPIVTLAVFTALLLSLILEFGPLWLVAMAVPAALYGPYWAGLMSTLGLGGLLAGRLPLGRATGLSAVVGLMIVASVALTIRTNLVVVTVAQVVLALLAMVASIHVTRLLHDAVPSAIRSGVASGVGTLTWLVFLPMALVFGEVSQRIGVHTAGWMIVGTTVLAGVLLLVVVVLRPGPSPAVATSADTTTGLHCDEFVELVSSFIADTLDAETRRRFVDHLLTCEGCERYLDQFRQTIETLGYLPAERVPAEACDAILDGFRRQPAQP